MGNCIVCMSGEEREAHKRNLDIERRIQEEQLKLGKEIKILLLGTGESGKSTIVKQMKILHQNGYSKEELASFRADIYRNMIESMQSIIRAMELMDAQFVDPVALRMSQVITNVGVDLSTQALDPELVEAVKYLWTESGIKALYEKLIKVTYVIDSAPYFFDEVERIGSATYIPTVADVLKARIKTTGISETRFKMGLVQIHMFDVGGQRSERKKWIHCFENVTSVIFCVALSEYDQVLLEESNQNRMLESFVLFESIINSQWFFRSSIILFLNKIDIFRSKLETSPLGQYFEDYTGGNDFDAAADFLRNKFLSLNHSRLMIYPHLTCATDTKQIELVFAAVKETILANALKETGII